MSRSGIPLADKRLQEIKVLKAMYVEAVNEGNARYEQLRSKADHLASAMAALLHSLGGAAVVTSNVIAESKSYTDLGVRPWLSEDGEVLGALLSVTIPTESEEEE
jgi:hypothetical protein